MVNYGHFRRARGDGNCFYRCFMFSLLEQFARNKDLLDVPGNYKEVYDSVLAKVVESGSLLSAAGFEPICYEDFIDLLCSKLQSVRQSTVEGIKADFEEKMISDSFVMYSRFLTSAYLRLNFERFEGFTEGYATVIDFCKGEVEPMDREAEQLQIMAVAEVFNVRIRIQYLDRSDKDYCAEIVYPVDYAGPDFTVNLLYRPGHYDLLYPNK
jgi:ubiquitin thioesterase protein OTUB1